MFLGSLTVVHLAKLQRGCQTQVQPRMLGALEGAFSIETCQRWLWVSPSGPSLRGLEGLSGLKIYRGEEAYGFLLRVATGLESEVVGETDIFGQVKEAWQKYVASPASPFAHSLGAVFHKLFEDTKEIRSRHLQNLGGASYGTLVRKLLRERSSKGPILIVGAGQIARSVVPFLTDNEIWVWNRSPANLMAMGELLACKGARSPRLITGAAEEERAWREARHAVICIPLDAENDVRRIAQWNRGMRAGVEKGLIVHLGGLREQCGLWVKGDGVPGFRSLDDVFLLQKEQGEVRSLQIIRAAKACEERAKLRGLGGPVTLPHGWEDLAVFA